MQYVLEHKVSGFEGIRFGVNMKKLTKSAKNRSYPNLSDCCGAVLKQKKFCAGCGVEVNGTPKNKQFKLGKEEYKISTEHLEQIRESLDSVSICVSSYVKKEEIPSEYFGDGIFHLGQTKQKKEYTELARAIELSGLVGVGTFVYNSRPYPFMMYSLNGHLMLRSLLFEDELNEMTEIEPAVVNEEKVKLIAGVMRLKSKSFNISEYVNIREQQEQELISKVIAGEELPEIETVILEQESQNDQEEIMKLQAILAEVN